MWLKSTVCKIITGGKIPQVLKVQLMVQAPLLLPPMITGGISTDGNKSITYCTSTTSGTSTTGFTTDDHCWYQYNWL
jgi:hypothetical protein